MVPNQKGAGRPPKTDGKGKQIATTHVTLTVPVNLKEFVQALPNPNMSALFTRIVTSLYIGEICPKCYSDNYIITSPIGKECTNCDIWVRLNNCPSCDRGMDPRQYIGMARNWNYNPAHGKANCSKCIKEVEDAN